MITEEVWRNIPGYEGYYQASVYGKIRSLDRVDRLGRFYKGKILKLRKDIFGYLIVTLSVKGKYKNNKVHRLVALTFIPNLKNLPQINHKNGIKDDNEVGNLEWCTNKENQIHAIKYLNVNERKIRGEKHKSRKLTKNQVIKIKGLFKEGELNQRQIAEKYGVSPRSISYIKSGKNWRHVKD